MHKFIKHLVLSILYFALLTTTSSAKESSTEDMVNAEDARNKMIAAVVNDQLDAFSKDDGERAFSHASPMIQAHFKTPEVFMRMVKTGYQMVYRPKFFELKSIREANGTIFQPVLFTDQNSQLYKVLYQMQQQEDDSWKINGVQVPRPKGLAI